MPRRSKSRHKERLAEIADAFQAAYKEAQGKAFESLWEPRKAQERALFTVEEQEVLDRARDIIGAYLDRELAKTEADRPPRTY